MSNSIKATTSLIEGSLPGPGAVHAHREEAARVLEQNEQNINGSTAS